MSNRRLVHATALSVLVLSPVSVFAQIESPLPELVTDRPDFTESSNVVGRGILQVEMGTTLESNGKDADRDRTLTTPLALMRIGVSKRIELRFGTDGYMLDTTGIGAAQAVTRGQSDLEVGAKVVLLDESHRVQFAVIPMASLPTGKAGITSGTVDPTVKLTWATSLPRNFALSGNANLERLGDDHGRYTESVLSFSLGHDLGLGWGGYWEAFGFMPKGRPGNAAWTVDTGITHGIGGNLQIDLEVGRGVTAAAPDWFIGAGVGIRTSLLRPRR